MNRIVFGLSMLCTFLASAHELPLEPVEGDWELRKYYVAKPVNKNPVVVSYAGVVATFNDLDMCVAAWGQARSRDKAIAFGDSWFVCDPAGKKPMEEGWDFSRKLL